MGVTVVPLGGPQPAPDQVELGLRRRDASLRLLLEGVQDVDGGLEPDRVDGPEGVAVVARDDLHDARAEALQRLGVAVAASELGAVDREAHAALHRVGESLQIRLARPHPFDWLQHDSVDSAL